MKRILFLGDSITDAGHSFDYEDLGKGYVRMIDTALRFQNQKVKTYNRGTDGFTIKNVKRFWDLHHSKLSPDVITILAGINDIAVLKSTENSADIFLENFRQTYSELLSNIRRTFDGPIILMEPFIFPYPAEYISWEENVSQISAEIQALAADYNVHFVALKNKLNIAADTHGFKAITTDGIHLTRQGHLVLAEAWLELYSKLH